MMRKVFVFVLVLMLMGWKFCILCEMERVFNRIMSFVRLSSMLSVRRWFCVGGFCIGEFMMCFVDGLLWWVWFLGKFFVNSRFCVMMDLY